MPTPSAPVPKFSYADKMIHGCAYGVLTLLASWFVSQHRSLTTRICLFIGAATVAYGGMMEIAQGVFTQDRTPECADLAANALGVLAALFLIAAFGMSQKTKSFY